MRIEGNSLIRYLCTALEGEMENSAIPKELVDRSLKNSLSFSSEGWAAGSASERSILDPSSVISRMFAVEVEKKLQQRCDCDCPQNHELYLRAPSSESDQSLLL